MKFCKGCRNEYRWLLFPLGDPNHGSRVSIAALGLLQGYRQAVRMVRFSGAMMKLREDWRNLRRMYSVHVKALGVTVAGSWIAIPEWIRAKLPAFTETAVVYGCGALFVVGIIVQCIDQSLGETQDATDDSK
jgi:hypothetical protein